MATEGGGKEMNEIKTQFTTREGLYKLLPHSEYSRPNRVPFNSQGSNPVRVSFVNLNDQSGNGDRLCFNVGRELYFYIYKGVRKQVLDGSAGPGEKMRQVIPSCFLPAAPLPRPAPCRPAPLTSLRRGSLPCPCGKRFSGDREAAPQIVAVKIQ
ncbi:WD repeat-containing protein 20 isoform X12 [Lynx canadensis]|uniref:WD repeat-containing protein 20 isoform X8 n=1 Tax=Acinonyx jubatus TaxID=32536 RepID=A0ABM3QAI0_ACIJB|nr:WD repeat-containing protein 20 isoform X12 [Lynx canadensis]XP_030175872.1 WD repeat-containing protein 20 isoform X12 [Lynx canadensis]XP_053080924.1 WD repeat-containing protein 20 isoform X8 [Acinonyx jubatus]